LPNKIVASVGRQLSLEAFEAPFSDEHSSYNVEFCGYGKSILRKWFCSPFLSVIVLSGSSDRLICSCHWSCYNIVYFILCWIM